MLQLTDRRLGLWDKKNLVRDRHDAQFQCDLLLTFAIASTVNIDPSRTKGQPNPIGLRVLYMQQIRHKSVRSTYAYLWFLPKTIQGIRLLASFGPSATTDQSQTLPISDPHRRLPGSFSHLPCANPSWWATPCRSSRRWRAPSWAPPAVLPLGFIGFGDAKRRFQG